MIGASAGDIRGTVTVTLQSTVQLPCILKRESTIKEWMAYARGKPALAAQIQQLLSPMAAAFGGGVDGNDVIGMDTMTFMMDLPLLIGHVLRCLCSASGIAVPELSENTMKSLLTHDYPGNVRELENILEHALIVCQGGTVRVRHLPGYLLEQAQSADLTPSGSRIVRPAPTGHERDRILTELHRHHWIRSRTARALGMDRTTLWRKIKRYRLMP